MWHSCIHTALNSIDQSRTIWRFIQDQKRLFSGWWKHYLEWKGCLLNVLLTKVCKASYMQKCQFHDTQWKMLASRWKTNEAFWRAFTTRALFLFDEGVLCSFVLKHTCKMTKFFPEYFRSALCEGLNKKADWRIKSCWSNFLSFDLNMDEIKW